MADQQHLLLHTDTNNAGLLRCRAGLLHNWGQRLRMLDDGLSWQQPDHRIGHLLSKREHRTRRQRNLLLDGEWRLRLRGRQLQWLLRQRPTGCNVHAVLRHGSRAVLRFGNPRRRVQLLRLRWRQQRLGRLESVRWHGQRSVLPKGQRVLPGWVALHL